jgi:hypothetical protein
MITITVNHDHEKLVLQFPNELDMEELRDKFAVIAFFLTFHPDTISEYLYAESQKDK